MAITMHASGAITVEGTEAMKLYRMLTIRSGLSLELKGMRLSRGRSCYSIAKAEFGLRGNKAKVLAAFSKLCDEQNAKVTRVVEPGCPDPERLSPAGGAS